MMWWFCLISKHCKPSDNQKWNKKLLSYGLVINTSNCAEYSIKFKQSKLPESLVAIVQLGRQLLTKSTHLHSVVCMFPVASHGLCMSNVCFPTVVYCACLSNDSISSRLPAKRWHFCQKLQYPLHFKLFPKRDLTSIRRRLRLIFSPPCLLRTKPISRCDAVHPHHTSPATSIRNRATRSYFPQLLPKTFTFCSVILS